MNNEVLVPIWVLLLILNYIYWVTIYIWWLIHESNK